MTIATVVALEIDRLLAGYRAREFTPEAVARAALERAANDTRHAWIRVLTFDEVQPYLDALSGKDPDTLPLFGVPFAIKDNIDLAGIPTTAGCAEFAYVPEYSAYAVERLIAAGAIPIGKTNLDQFATGLNGTRTPYGACQNAFNPEYISGGSSSGSAVAVACGQVSFALGTDTAGSGRVPAAFNNIVGVKPTRGIVSTRGVVPACRSLDCVSIFALTTGDAHAVLRQIAHYDHQESFARRTAPAPATIAETFRFGVPLPVQYEFFGDTEYARLFEDARQQLQALGGECVEIDCTPFFAAAKLLYDGPWVAERYAAIEDFLHGHADALLPVTRAIITQSPRGDAVTTFKAMYQLAELHRRAEQALSLDFLVFPTAPAIYRIDELMRDPVTQNSRLGYYTNFVNLLDMSAIAIPAGFRADGLPFGITLMSRAHMDEPLLAIAQRFHQAQSTTMGALKIPLPRTEKFSIPTGWVRIAVCGAHMSGLPLNPELRKRGGQWLENAKTSKNYRFYALPGGPPRRPGLVRTANGGEIDLEIWALPPASAGDFLTTIPAPLGIGMIELNDGRRVQGFLCEAYATEGAQDITHLGGWRRFLATL